VKLGGQKMIRLVFLGITGMTVWFVLVPVVALSGSELLTLLLPLALGAVAVGALYYYPEWWVIDSAGVLMSVGLTAILGISFGPIPALVLLVALAIYDAIAVYKTKHMIDLADTVMSQSLPIMFVIPKHSGYSFLKKERTLKEQIASGEQRDALFMGLGDVIIPGALVVSAYKFLRLPLDTPGFPEGTPLFLGMAGNVAVAMVTLVGGLIGYALLMRAVLKGNPQAGLPLLNGGTVAAFLLAVWAVFGTFDVISF
jgi:presenilin-like A22 family membrane protease